MFNSIAVALTALAQAFTEREKNVRLRLISETAKDLHETKILLLQYHAAGDIGLIELGTLRLRHLEDFLAAITPASAKAPDNAVAVPPKAKSVDPQ